MQDRSTHEHIGEATAVLLRHLVVTCWSKMWLVCMCTYSHTYVHTTCIHVCTQLNMACIDYCIYVHKCPNRHQSHVLQLPEVSTYLLQFSYNLSRFHILKFCACQAYLASAKSSQLSFHKNYLLWTVLAYCHITGPRKNGQIDASSSKNNGS